MKFIEDHYKMQETEALQVEDSAKPSGFVRQGSLRKVIPGEHNENLFLNQRGELNKLYTSIHLEYMILAEYKTVMTEEIPGIYVIPSRQNFLEWFGVIFVKRGLYEDGIFRFNLILDPEFPNTIKHPIVRFQSRMFHPAIDPESNELNVSKAFPKWDKVENHVWQVLKFVLWSFENLEGSLSYTVNEEAAHLFKSNKEEFKDSVKRIVAEGVDHLYDEPPMDDKHYITFEPYDSNVHETARAQLLTQKHDDFFKFQNSWVLPGTLTPLGRPPTPDSDQDS
ncbi:hypothetical protein HHI36_004111 [Cryptolaemus montrouzieri]|uniref:UBC core domain-containing protein n=1 Tax=Cryptolaemus montrouzieri TaxID=559131 RepID=A0ABD2NQN6_9CUCU